MIRQTVALFAVTMTTPRGAPPEAAVTVTEICPACSRPNVTVAADRATLVVVWIWPGAPAPAPADRSATNPWRCPAASVLDPPNAQLPGVAQDAELSVGLVPVPVSCCALPQAPPAWTATKTCSAGVLSSYTPPAAQLPAVAHDTALADAASVPPPRAAMPGISRALPQVPFTSDTANALVPRRLVLNWPVTVQLPADLQDTAVIREKPPVPVSAARPGTSRGAPQAEFTSLRTNDVRVRVALVSVHPAATQLPGAPHDTVICGGAPISRRPPPLVPGSGKAGLQEPLAAVEATQDGRSSLTSE